MTTSTRISDKFGNTVVLLVAAVLIFRPSWIISLISLLIGVAK